MKRAKKRSAPKAHNPVARSPLLGKDGAHGQSNAARQANVELRGVAHEGDS
jgi:hypothetical protein